MSTIEEMRSRYTELESIAINAPDVLARRRATEERINLALLIQKDPQNAAAKQAARIATSDNQIAEANRIRAAMTETENEVSRMPVGSKERAAGMSRLISLRLQLERLQTTTEAI